MSFLVTCSNVPHRSIKTKSARFSTGRDKQCKGRTKHGRKERIHSCHHWVDFSMTLGRTGQRTIGWRRHGWALKLKWKRTTDHTRLWDPKCHQSAKNRRVFRSTSRQEHPCSTYMISFFSQKIDNFSLFSIFLHFLVKKQQKKKKTEKHDLKKHFLKWKPNAGYPTGAKPKRKKIKERKQEKQEKQLKKRKKQRKKQIRKKKKIHKKKRENMSPFCNLYPITATQFIFGKLFPEIML